MEQAVVTNADGTTIWTYSTDGFLQRVDGAGAWRSPFYACPDMLTIDNLGVADNLRGRVIRAFFRLMRPWKP